MGRGRRGRGSTVGRAPGDIYEVAQEDHARCFDEGVEPRRDGHVRLQRVAMCIRGQTQHFQNWDYIQFNYIDNNFDLSAAN
eukprot:244300-Prymnesium_polylepis.1